ncbi:DUF1090 family protein [Thauera sp. SDU_THAU2]|uniref:DUF1090 family protein n=1 Tax=Thauera sp. SDU_THAU2 TaxID=3136633 RepID=UPI00311FE7DB
MIILIILWAFDTDVPTCGARCSFPIRRFACDDSKLEPDTGNEAMKRKTIPMLLVVIAAFAPATSIAAESDPCLEKSREIESQMEHARAHGNRDRLAGLERALAAVEANCTPERAAAGA